LKSARHAARAPGAPSGRELGDSAERRQHHSAGSEQMLQITTKKPTTTAITMASTVQASTEASDMRRLGGVSKSFGGLEADGTAGERPAAGACGGSEHHDAARRYPHLPRSECYEAGCAGDHKSPSTRVAILSAPFSSLIS
jgi:hypothetical protein